MGSRKSSNPEVKAVAHLSTIEAAKWLGVAPGFLRKARLAGNGPPFIRASRTLCLYAISDLQAWTDARRFTSTTEEAVQRRAA